MTPPRPAPFVVTLLGTSILVAIFLGPLFAAAWFVLALGAGLMTFRMFIAGGLLLGLSVPIGLFAWSGLDARPRMYAATAPPPPPADPAFTAPPQPVVAGFDRGPLSN